METVGTLGQFEQLVLIAAFLLSGEGYVIKIHEKVCELGGKRYQLGTVFVSLERMAKRGLVTSWYEEPGAERRGRAKRFFKVTPAGKLALKQAKVTAAVIVNGLKDLI